MTEPTLTKAELETMSRDAALSIAQSALTLAKRFGVDISDIAKPTPCQCPAYQCDVEIVTEYAAIILERASQEAIRNAR